MKVFRPVYRYESFIYIVCSEFHGVSWEFSDANCSDTICLEYLEVSLGFVFTSCGQLRSCASSSYCSDHFMDANRLYKVFSEFLGVY